MKVTSVNRHIREEEALGVRVRGSWFIVTYAKEEVFYNLDGREVFRVTKRSFWQKLKELYANSDSTSIL